MSDPKRLRVALTCPYAWDDPGGVQVHVRELAERLRSRHHEVVVLAPLRGGEVPLGVRRVGRPIDIPYNASNAPIDPRPWAIRAVRAELRRFRPDVIHAHEPLAPSTSLWATLAGDVPVVGTFHSGASRSRLYDLAAPLLRRVARRLAIRVAVSEAAARFAARRIGGSFEIVPNGVDVRRFANAEPSSLGDGRKLLFVGRLDRRKGFPVAVEAFGRLAEDRPDLRLVVAGDGPDRDAITSLAPSVRDRVTMLGTVPHQDLPPIHAACDVYLGCAVGGESFGIVLVEALAAGVPVVASDIAGYSEVIREGEDGLLVPARNASALAAGVTRVLDDPMLAERLRKGGRRRARSFDWAVVTDAIEQRYRRATASPASLR
jgi:phosphatidyl-myo-inositol alpha-mannosyltransferase